MKEKRKSVTATAVVQASGLNHQGQGVCRLDDGLCVFVDGLLPGESARVQVLERKKTYARAKIVELLEHSPERVVPPCPLFGRCGGCTLQHCSYETQLRLKADAVRSALVRLGAFPAEQIEKLLPAGSLARASEKPWAYRCKSSMPLGGSATAPLIGFYEANSHRIADATLCPIQHPAADLARAALRESWQKHPVSAYDEAKRRGLLRHLIVRGSKAYPDVLLTLALNLSEKDWENLPSNSLERLFIKDFQSHCTDALSSEGYVLSEFWLNHNCRAGNRICGPNYTQVHSGGPLRERICGIEYQLSPAAFFQVNPWQTEALYAAVVRAAGLNDHETAMDLYCGSGSISLQLATRARRVIGCEIVEAAIADAKANAELNRIENCEFYSGAAENLLPALLAEGKKADVIVVDPPRKGLDASLIDGLLESHGSRIVYVSCDPATLARDCARLCASARYELRSVECFDMFPHTTHVECIVCIQRKTL